MIQCEAQIFRKVLYWGKYAQLITYASIAFQFLHIHAYLNLLQAIVTAPHCRRLGHATILLSEVEQWLSLSGIPWLVAAVPETAKEGPSARKLLSKHSFKPLQDLSIIAVGRLFFCICRSRAELVGSKWLSIRVIGLASIDAGKVQM